MAEIISTAGKAPTEAAPNHRRDAIAVIRAVIRKADSSDDEVDDALEALVELSKD